MHYAIKFLPEMTAEGVAAAAAAAAGRNDSTTIITLR